MPSETFFLHGLDSSGNGTKGRFFRDHFPAVIRPDFHGELADRLAQLIDLCRNRSRLTLIGSSFGGLMAACYAADHPNQVARLILLAPALNFARYRPPANRITIPTLVVIGTRDTVTPAAIVAPLAEASFATLDLKLVDDDHLLHATFPTLDWNGLLDSATV